ncbi:hypothetical protein [Paenibacillus polymyxa]|uniref:Uncharacterized protein n=1 Tax=Paenibacillus polymyxa (strain SC2) TaxID=886882 RepID=E3EKJ3_PAEPS|nr:hypothetical protein [Paenibacillus polymyxa]ADO59825.1 hypothetical protein PPSC2_26060 [Paenibacillus polymyxa SC2]WPQ59943.1 hypothetical protein SKN87_27255 [Paenibacillus polymyxa]
MKKTAIILTGALALMAVAPMAASAQTTSIEPTTEQSTSKQQIEINSPSDYVKWLKGQAGAEETLEQFSKLSESDQDKFVKYLNDVDVQKQVVKAFGSEKDVSLFGGDIVVSHKEDAPSKDTSSKVTPQAMNYTVSDSSKGTFLGITVSELRSTVTYRVSGTPGNQQIEVLSGGGMVVRNYNPIIGITVNQERPYTSADRQYAYQVNYFAHDFKGTWGLTYGTVKHTLSGDTQGREVRLISETL